MRNPALVLALGLLTVGHPAFAQGRESNATAEPKPVPLKGTVNLAQLSFEESLVLGLTRLCPQFIRGEGLTGDGRPTGGSMVAWLESGFVPTAFGPESALPRSGDYASTFRHNGSGKIEITFGEKLGLRYCDIEIVARGDEGELTFVQTVLLDNGYSKTDASDAGFRSEDLVVSIPPERIKADKTVFVEFRASDE